MKHATILGLFLFGAYLLWSGLAWPWGEHYHPLLLWTGLASTAIVVYLALRMKIVDAEGAPVQLTNVRLLWYLPWLGKEIAKSNVEVVRRILAPRVRISPRIIEVAAGQQSEIGQVIYANSITLTPGTVSVFVEGGNITVHAVSREAAEGLQTDEMNQRVIALERPA